MNWTQIATPPGPETRLRVECRHEPGAHGRYKLLAFDGDKQVHSAEYAWNEWMGHACGQLLMPDFVEAANRAAARACNTTVDQEAYYDEHIAPKLMALAGECRDNGLSLLAVCEWAPGAYGNTLTLCKDSSFALRMIDAAAQAGGNIDSLMTALERHAREHGHSSLYLRMLGVPTTPETSDKDTTHG